MHVGAVNGAGSRGGKAWGRGEVHELEGAWWEIEEDWQGFKGRKHLYEDQQYICV